MTSRLHGLFRREELNPSVHVPIANLLAGLLGLRSSETH
jgi:hypothetical protein